MSREKKSLCGSLYYPVPEPVLYAVFRLVVSKSRLGELDRADTAQRVVIDVLRCILHHDAVPCDAGNIIHGVDENDGFGVCGVYDAADLIKKVDAQCQQMTPVIRPLFTTASIDGKPVVSAEIQEIDNSDKPCFYSGVGNPKQKATFLRLRRLQCRCL